MINIENLVRPNIKRLKPYSSARDEYKGAKGVFLDANESPFGAFNRYSDPLQMTLKKEFSRLKKVPLENIFISSGSDEVIDLLFRVFCEPRKDKVMVLTPTYGMYQVCAETHDIEVLKMALNDSFQINLPSTLKALKDPHLKLLFICTPNNPTGNSINWVDIKQVLETFKGIVVLDEAYIDFSAQPSACSKIKDYNNLVVIQTMSKAWGFASGRIGIGFAKNNIIDYLNKVKMPYNVSGPSQQEALKILGKHETYKSNLKVILAEREKLKEALLKFDFVEKIFPSETNFLLIKVLNAKKLYKRLLESKIIIRIRDSEIKNCVRISIGTPQENKILIAALNNLEFCPFSTYF
jgi:histidinol-phosphate aminotransferase